MGKQEPESHWTIVNALTPIILENVKGCVVEIGIGGSTHVLSRHARKFKRKHYSCDNNSRLTDWFEDNDPHPDHVLFSGRSIKFISEFNDKPALVFLDGAHRYNDIKAELDFFIPLLEPGGVMFLHDVEPTQKYIEWKNKHGRFLDSIVIRRELEFNSSIYTFVWPYTAGNMGLMMITKKRLFDNMWSLVKEYYEGNKE